MKIKLSSQEKQNACHDTPRKERLFFSAFHFIKFSPKSFLEPKPGRLNLPIKLFRLHSYTLMLQKMNLALRADFSDRINRIYMILIYPDYPVDPVQKMEIPIL